VLVRGAGFSFAWLDAVMHAADASAALRAVARDARFREAVTWQNRSAVVDGLDSLLRKAPGATDAKTRKKELLVVRYLQRYCAKNDTIGFFGPVGWARWGAEGRFVPQAELVERRATFAEPWMARVLADALARDPSLRRSATVRLPGDVRVEGRKLITAGDVQTLTREEAALLRRLQDEGPLRYTRVPAKQRALLESLAEANVVRIAFPVAISAEPFRALPPPVRRAAAPVLDALAALRDPGGAGARGESNPPAGNRSEPQEHLKYGFSAPSSDQHPFDSAFGSAQGERLNGLLARLETAFTAQTLHAPKRHEGRTYGGRGLVYEECRRAIELTLSPQMLARIARPLSRVLDVARWYTFEVARTLERALQRRFERPTPLHVFWQQTAPLFSGDPPPVLKPALEKLRALRLEDAPLSAPHPGWPTARHHAPDLLWAAPSAEAMLRGEGTPVLGELHPGVTPFTTLSVLAHAPDRKALEQQWRRDFPPDLISPIPWEDFARSSQDLRLAARHWHLDLGFELDSDRADSRVLRAADFDVRRIGGALWAVHRRRPLRFPLIQVFERRIKLIAATAFSLSDGAPTSPRRTLGDLVIARARWRFGPEQLAWLGEPPGRIERAQTFRAEHRLPQRVFVRSPDEVKPLYVDLGAPLLLEMLARLARGAAWLSFSEMLPAPGELWLHDAAGAPYVCELRCIAVDPLAHPSVAEQTR
jgi:hypothetical protein